MLCFAGLHKSLMHNKRIRVTAGKYQGECVKLWRVVGVAENLGTLAEIVWTGWFWLCSQIKCWQAVAVLPYATKWHAARCPSVRKSLTKAIRLGFCRLVSIISKSGWPLFEKKVSFATRCADWRPQVHGS